MDRIEFLKRRKTGIGSSDAAAVMGLSKWRTPYDVWKDKTTEEVIDDSNDTLELASHLEDYVARKYAEATGHNVRRWNTELVCDEFPFLKANIDREIMLDKRGVGILECKALSHFYFKKVVEQGLPDEYIIQIQHQYLCDSKNKYKWAAFAILDRDSGKMLTFEVEPEAGLQTQICDICIPFWKEYVEKRVPPPAEKKVAFDANTLPKYNGTVTNLTEDTELADLIKTYNDQNEMLSEVQELVDQTKKMIADKMEASKSEAADAIGARIYYRRTIRHTLDGKRIAKEIPAVYMKYLKESVSKTLKIYAKDNN